MFTNPDHFDFSDQDGRLDHPGLIAATVIIWIFALIGAVTVLTELLRLLGVAS